MELRLAGRKALLELEQRRVLQARLEAAYRSKGEFLASLSHEMRSPLNSIRGIGNMLAISTKAVPICSRWLATSWNIRRPRLAASNSAIRGFPSPRL